jgi:hypothetical protein
MLVAAAVVMAGAVLALALLPARERTTADEPARASSAVARGPLAEPVAA